MDKQTNIRKMEKKIKNTTIKLVNLNNKSRQGTYIYIKHKNKPHRYYKLTGETGQIEATKKYYEKQINKEQNKKWERNYKTYKKIWNQASKQETSDKKHEKIRTEADKYIAKLRKTKKITKQLKKGTNTINTKQAENANENTIKSKNRELLYNMILDKDILEIMTQENNLEKIKNRTQHTIKILNEQGETILTSERYNCTLKQAIKEIKDSMKKIDKNIKKDNKYKEGITNNLETRGWRNTNTIKEGYIYRIDLETTIKKG